MLSHQVVLLLSLFASSFSLDWEAGKSVPDIIAHWGYPAETFKATTKDGYILTLHRIPFGKISQPSDKPKPVVFLQHGLLANSNNWITNLPHLALGYMLADAGYDVWMGNVRGNVWSMDHTTLNPKGHEFWKFSWDEFAKYDLDAMIDKALQITNQKTLYYVGHSQGTLMMFAKLSKDPQFALKIKKFYALAPVNTVKDIKGLLSFIAHYLANGLEAVFKALGFDQFLPDQGWLKGIEYLFCDNPFTDGICGNVLFMMSGTSSNQMNDTRLDVFLTDEPSDTSTQNIIHWAQMVKSGKMQMYDFSTPEQNKLHYGQDTPPLYDISEIKNTKIDIYWSPDDWLADEKDINNYLLAKIPKDVLQNNVKLDRFNHLDFIWGQRAATEIYLPIMDDLAEQVINNQH
ncbi:hypothetical protein QR680_004898 [Steinernema hermaphroditum]|uniref:Lipase n=1 Tax=Steinernema hermaphroditum TaxID=289476 RepID=A0AA39LUF1_9BILA|nr:hypothetical protein QR680_004898 [Steinernema hermaphroditum]